MAYHEAGHAIVAERVPDRRPGAQDLHHPARGGGARLHAAAPHRGPLPAHQAGADGPHRGAPRRAGGRGDRLQRDLHRRRERPGADDRPGAAHGDGVRDVARAGADQLRGAAALPVPPQRRRRRRRTRESTRRTRRARSTRRSTASSTAPTSGCAGSSQADRDILEELAQRLLEKEVVDEAELREIMGLPPRTKEPDEENVVAPPPPKGERGPDEATLRRAWRGERGTEARGAGERRTGTQRSRRADERERSDRRRARRRRRSRNRPQPERMVTPQEAAGRGRWRSWRTRRRRRGRDRVEEE